jgi:perosamine synthetase
VIPVNEPLLDGNEKTYLLQCIETGWISSEGPFIKTFETEFARRVGRKHAIAVANGTAALDIAIESLGVGLGDEVILPTFTIISCIVQIVRSGATPVLVETDPITWNMDVGQIEAKITPRTKAIVAAHTYGLPVDMDPLLEIATRHGIKVIEDASQMHGQTYRDRSCGSFGEISTFSFYPNKHVTTGEGGMVVTDDDMSAEKARSLRNLCFQPHKRFVHESLGWNYRMTNMQAALGMAQLERLNEFIDRKRAMGLLYNHLLADTAGIHLPLPRTEYAENIYWVYALVLDDIIPFDAEEAMRRLATKGVDSRPFFWSMHEQPVFKKMGLFRNERYPVAERIARRGIYLPSGMALTTDQIERSAQALKEILA